MVDQELVVRPCQKSSVFTIVLNVHTGGRSEKQARGGRVERGET